MTCIVGIVKDGVIHMGADSCGATDYVRTARKDPKLFVVNDKFIIGGTTSFRMLQLLNFKLNPPKRKGKDVYEYMCTDFIDSVRTVFKEGGFIQRNNDAEKGGLFLVGYKGRLFTIDSDFQVGEQLSGYASVGSGQETALGSLYTSERLRHTDPQQRIEMALSAATYFTTSVLPPFQYCNSIDKQLKQL